MGSINYNIGSSILPKLKDPPFFDAPCNREPLGLTRDICSTIDNLAFVFEDQGFRLRKGWIEESILWISLINNCYRQEEKVRERIEAVLAALTPSNISCVIVIIEAFGIPCQQYVYPRDLLVKYAEGAICKAELDILTSRGEFTSIPCEADPIFCRRLETLESQF